MQFIRVAALQEVLVATPDDEPTRNVTRRCPQFGVWSFGGQDLGRIGAQLPDGKMGAVWELFAEWKTWLGSSDPRAPSSAARHHRFVQLLREGRTFDVRAIILGHAMQIHDGKHRLFAAYEFVTKHAGNQGFEVFWDRIG